jgi:hypothetical protein
MSPSRIGLLVGIALGFAVAFGGFTAFAIVALFMVICFAVGKVVEGDLDLSPYLFGRGRNRR